MTNNILAQTTGNSYVDDICIGLMELTTSVLSEQRFSLYIQGSYAEHSATVLSDIDLVFVFHESLAPAQRTLLRHLVNASKRLSPYSLDVVFLTHEELLQTHRPDVWRNELLVVYATTLKYDSQCLFGEDCRAIIAELPPNVYTRVRMHVPITVLLGQRGHPDRLSYPLLPPDTTDLYLGYTARLFRAHDHRLYPSAKRLLHGTGYIVTALTAYYGQGNIGSRRKAIARYCAIEANPWKTFIHELDYWCYQTWNYCVPDTPEAQQRLQHLCHEAVRFETAYLEYYQDFLQRELATGDETIVLHTLMKMQKITVSEVDLRDAVVSLQGVYSEAIEHAVKHILAQVERP